MENDDLIGAEGPPPGRSKWLRAGIGAAVLLSVLMIVAGYLIGAQFGGGTASNAGPTSAPAAKQKGDAAQYVACMRSNGVKNFPDPGPGGRLRIKPEDGLDPNSETFKKADTACKELMPADVPAQGNPGPQISGGAPASFVAAPIDTREYVSCMRQNGVPDFPDPVNGMFSYDARTDAAKAADRICRKFLPSDAPPPPE